MTAHDYSLSLNRSYCIRMSRKIKEEKFLVGGVFLTADVVYSRQFSKLKFRQNGQKLTMKLTVRREK